MPTYSDEAVVLRTHDLAEADRIVTLLTRRHGKVRAVAKGVRRTSSKFGARLEPFSQVDLQLVEGRSLHIVAQAMTREPFGEALIGDYGVWTTGQVMLETADKLVVEDHEPAVQQYLLPRAFPRDRGLRAHAHPLRPLRRRDRGLLQPGERRGGVRPVSPGRVRTADRRRPALSRGAAHRRLARHP